MWLLNFTRVTRNYSMHYFSLASSQQESIKVWQQSQFDLCDIVLSLTDKNIMIGAKIYAIFCRKEVRSLMQFYVCDFKKIKDELGIVGEYVERKGNVFDKNFNPKRNPIFLALSPAQMQIFANIIYNNLMQDLKEISEALKN